MCILARFLWAGKIHFPFSQLLFSSFRRQRELDSFVQQRLMQLLLFFCSLTIPRHASFLAIKGIFFIIIIITFILRLSVRAALFTAPHHFSGPALTQKYLSLVSLAKKKEKVYISLLNDSIKSLTSISHHFLGDLRNYLWSFSTLFSVSRSSRIIN